MTEEQLVLVGALLTAGLVQGTLGFGFGMISMAVLPHWFGVREVVPVVSLLGLVICVSVYWRWRASLDLASIRPVLLGITVGAPLGAYLLSSVDRRLALGLLGSVMLLVAVPSMLAACRKRSLAARPTGTSRAVGVLAGFISGLFGGAFNTGGPPVILYGSAKAWSPAAFRANLQVVFFFSSVLQLGVLARTGVATRASLELTAIGLPAILCGVALGTTLAKRLDTERFRIVVWALLIVLASNYLRQALV